MILQQISDGQMLLNWKWQEIFCKFEGYRCSSIRFQKQVFFCFKERKNVIPERRIGTPHFLDQKLSQIVYHRLKTCLPKSFCFNLPPREFGTTLCVRKY